MERRPHNRPPATTEEPLVRALEDIARKLGATYNLIKIAAAAIVISNLAGELFHTI